MSKLRHDLLTSGWSMADVSKWVASFNESWNLFPNKTWPDESKQPLKGFWEEWAWLLHEALPEEWFYLENVEARQPNDSFHYWHIDGGYLRVLFSCRGEGTIVARSFEDNVQTPPGYALIMTGQQRKWKMGIPETWHTAPHKQHNRRLVLLNFRNAE